MAAAGDTAPAGAFEVDLPLFQGPFRVLAELILEQGSVDVCDVPVARITEGFLRRGAEAEGWSLEEATWFLAICATLLELKAGRLMPRSERADEEDLLGPSPDIAYARSLELAAFRKLAKRFAEMFEEGARYVPRDVGPAEEFADLYPDPMERVTAEQLASAAASLLRPRTLDMSHVQPIRASVADALEAVRQRLTGRGETRFRDLVEDCRERIQVVVRFLALLELHAEGRVALRQADTFGEIEERWEE